MQNLCGDAFILKRKRERKKRRNVQDVTAHKRCHGVKCVCGCDARPPLWVVRSQPGVCAPGTLCSNLRGSLAFRVGASLRCLPGTYRGAPVQSVPISHRFLLLTATEVKAWLRSSEERRSNTRWIQTNEEEEEEEEKIQLCEIRISRNKVSYGTIKNMRVDLLEAVALVHLQTNKCGWFVVGTCSERCSLL